MKKLDKNLVQGLKGGYVCSQGPGNGNGNAYGTCFPSLCLFVGSVLAGTPAATDVFQVCPL